MNGMGAPLLNRAYKNENELVHKFRDARCSVAFHNLIKSRLELPISSSKGFGNGESWSYLRTLKLKRNINVPQVVAEPAEDVGGILDLVLLCKKRLISFELNAPRIRYSRNWSKNAKKAVLLRSSPMARKVTRLCCRKLLKTKNTQPLRRSHRQHLYMRRIYTNEICGLLSRYRVVRPKDVKKMNDTLILADLRPLMCRNRTK